jgi:hypothetical protein
VQVPGDVGDQRRCHRRDTQHEEPDRLELVLDVVAEDQRNNTLKARWRSSRKNMENSTAAMGLSETPAAA